MKNILYSSPFIPAEWIAAHGFKAVRVSPGIKRGTQPLDSAEGICPYLNRFLAEIKHENNVGGICLASTCDQMRRALDYINDNKSAPAFLMHVPSTWKSVPAQTLYFSELERLGSFLTQLGGKHPDRKVLAENMFTYDNRRKALKNLKGLLPAREYAEAIQNFNHSGQVREAGKDAKYSQSGIPIALIGGPLSSHDLILYDILEKAGGHVVLNGTESGERTLPRPFDRQITLENPLMELADAYFGSIADVFRRPNSELYIWMQREFSHNNVKGVILIRHIWCDLWHAESRRIQEWIPVPFIDIDLSSENPVLRNKTRIHAFMELLR